MFRFLNTLTKAVLLTLIEPSEVKVDLADFDLNLQENLLSTLLKKYLFLQKRLVDFLVKIRLDARYVQNNITLARVASHK
jgi:hypothetical protein